jgi:hypothetical protein
MLTAVRRYPALSVPLAVGRPELPVQSRDFAGSWPLAHAARQLERIGIELLLRILEAHLAEEISRHFARQRRIGFAMDAGRCQSAYKFDRAIVCRSESEVIGSWNIMAMHPPRISDILSPLRGSLAMSTMPCRAGSQNRIWPRVIWPF